MGLMHIGRGHRARIPCVRDRTDKSCDGVRYSASLGESMKIMTHTHRMAVAAISLAFGSAFAQAPTTAQDFAVLAGAAVTCTASTVAGNAGLANPGTITRTGCTINGAT